MVSLGTKLLVSDNSGAIRAKCIKILGSSFCNSSNIGDTLVVAIQSAKVKKKVTKGQVHRSILIRQRKKTFRKNGIYIRFTNNSVVLIKPNLDPIGSRIKGSVLQELRHKGCAKIMLLASNII